MNKRFLPFSLALVIMIFGQTISIADNGGHYVPRTQETASAERFMSELRANQNTGLIDPAWMLKAQNLNTRDASDDPLYWLSMGPDNMGGQTTGIVYDNKTNPNTGGATGVVYIGSKGGGVYKSYNYGLTWHQVGETSLMVSCMVQAADGTIYVGTGDGGAAATYNGLSDLGYDNSFVGSGIYRIVNDEVSVIPSTVPSTDNVSTWSFVNDIAVLGNTLLAATDGGLMSSNDNGATWATVLEGVCEEVKVTANNTLVISCDGEIYIGTLDNLVSHSASSIQYGEDGVTIIAIPKATGLLDIATSPTNSDIIYAGAISDKGSHSGFYVTYDEGETWEIVLPSIDPSVGGHDPYSGFGLYNHGIVVDPTNCDILYVLGYNLWRLQKPSSGQGYFMTAQLTNGSGTTYYSPSYLHVGLHTMAFNPNNANECYVGTDGGIYKATVRGGEFTFSYCNRNYLTTRMTNVAISGANKRIIASGLDHGIVLIEGAENVDTERHGQWINPSGYNSGAFSDDYHGGPCAISMINPNIFIVTSKGGSVNRTETAAEDWVSTNFTSHGSISISDNFRTPILLHENFNDPLNPATVWYKNTTGVALPAGTVIECMSQNNYPFEYTLTAALAARDSIEVHDPVSARMYLATSDAVYVTRTALDFATEAIWYELVQNNPDNAEFAGTPLCMAISADGENVFVGTIEGKLYRFMGDGSDNIDSIWYTYSSSGSISATHYNHYVAIDVMNLPTNGQCVTSVAVDPRNPNNVIVTLGNYGNDCYVCYSNNALAAEPTFVSKQANLPLMPIYSSVIEMSTGHVILGTEHGIYRAKDINSVNWVSDSKMMGAVPVMELKQQLLRQEDKAIVVISGNDTVVEIYPGVKSTGIVYAATYGCGAFRCENYKIVSGADVPETPVAVEKTVSIYPNPVVSQATAQFEADGTGNVNYQVYDLMGRLVKSQNLGRLTEGMHEIEINVSDLGSGSYILRISEGARIATAKFLVY